MDTTSGTSSAKTRPYDACDRQHQLNWTERTKLKQTYAFKCQSMSQWRNHGPGLSVRNRMVTSSESSVPAPMLTTSRMTGSTKLPCCWRYGLRGTHASRCSVNTCERIIAMYAGLHRAGGWDTKNERDQPDKKEAADLRSPVRQRQKWEL